MSILVLWHYFIKEIILTIIHFFNGVRIILNDTYL